MNHVRLKAEQDWSANKEAQHWTPGKISLGNMGISAVTKLHAAYTASNQSLFTT